MGQARLFPGKERLEIIVRERVCFILMSASAQRIYPYPSYRSREHKNVNVKTVADRQERLVFKHPFYRTRNYTVADTVLNGRKLLIGFDPAISPGLWRWNIHILRIESGTRRTEREDHQRIIQYQFAFLRWSFPPYVQSLR